MPARSGGAGSPSRMHAPEDWSDSSSISPPPHRSSTPVRRPSSVGEAEGDARKNFIDLVAARARTNLTGLATSNATSSNIISAAAPPSRVSNSTEQAPVNDRDKPKFQYPQPKHQPLPITTSLSEPAALRRADKYKSFETAADVLDEQLPPTNPRHFGPESALHTQYTIKTVSTAQCDECKGKSKGEEIYKCSTCVKQICKTCMEERLKKEMVGKTEAVLRKQQGQAEADEDDYKWQWQGQYCHDGLKLCYEERKAAGATGDYKIDVPLSVLSPSMGGEETVTVMMSREKEGDGKDKGKKRLQSDLSDNDDEAENGNGSPRANRKKAHKQNVPQSSPTLQAKDKADQADMIRRAVHGKKAAQQLNNIVAAAQKAGLERATQLDAEPDPSPRPRPSHLDLSAVQPSPGLPQAMSMQPLGNTQLGMSANPAMLLRQQQSLAQNYPQYQPAHPTSNVRRSQPREAPRTMGVPQGFQSSIGYPGPYVHPQYGYPVYLPYQAQTQTMGYNNFQQNHQRQWGPPPPPPSPPTRSGQPDIHAPPPGTWMDVTIGGRQMRMTWDEYQAMRRNIQPPSIDPAFRPTEVLRHGNNENVNRMPLPASHRSSAVNNMSRGMVSVPTNRGRSPRVKLSHNREVAMLPRMNTHDRPQSGLSASRRITDSVTRQPSERLVQDVNSRWSSSEETDRVVPQPDAVQDFTPVEHPVETPGATPGTRPETVHQAQYDPVREAAASGTNLVTASAEDDQAQAKHQPENKQDTPPKKYSSAPPEDLRPPRSFSGRPFERETTPAAPAQPVEPEQFPSSPPLPTVTDAKSDGQNRQPTVDKDEANKDEGISDGASSEVETEILSPTTRQRTTAEATRPQVTDNLEAPATPPRRMSTSVTSRRPANSAISPGSTGPPAYWGAHNSPGRAEQAITQEYTERVRRDAMRQILEQLPEAPTLGIVPRGTPSLVPSPQQNERVRSAAFASTATSKRHPKRKRLDPDPDPDATDSEPDGEQFDPDSYRNNEGYWLKAGGVSFGPQGVLKRGSRAATTPTSTDSLPRQQQSHDRGTTESPKGKGKAKAKGKAVARSQPRTAYEVDDEEEADNNVDTDPLPGPPTDDIDQDEDFDDDDDDDDHQDTDEDEDDHSSPIRRPSLQAHRARLMPAPSSRNIRHQSAAVARRTQLLPTERPRTATPASRGAITPTRRQGTTNVARGEDATNGEADNVDKFPWMNIPPTPTRRTRSGREYTGEADWDLGDYQGKGK